MVGYDEIVIESRLKLLGSLLGDKTRSKILIILMDGRARTGGELARYVGVSPSTASEHLAKLVDADMVSVEAHGRHRYFRLAGSEVADLLESLGVSAAPTTSPPLTAPATLAYARTCYDHLAGELAVRIHDQMLNEGHLVEDHRYLHVTESGYQLFEALGADSEAIRIGRRPPARSCLDWIERRHHLAGAAGAGILDAMLENRWLARGQRPRSITVTADGKKAITDFFGLPLSRG